VSFRGASSNIIETLLARISDGFVKKCSNNNVVNPNINSAVNNTTDTSLLS
jgi:hypothetical protein